MAGRQVVEAAEMVTAEVELGSTSMAAMRLTILAVMMATMAVHAFLNLIRAILLC